MIKEIPTKKLIVSTGLTETPIMVNNVLNWILVRLVIIPWKIGIIILLLYSYQEVIISGAVNNQVISV